MAHCSLDCPGGRIFQQKPLYNDALPRYSPCMSIPVAPATDQSLSPVIRCSWGSDATMLAYHDREWGVPVHDDRLLFEFLVLEGAQAGLSWRTILARREGYRRAFDGFDAQAIAVMARTSSSSCCRIQGSSATGSKSRRQSRMPGPSWQSRRRSVALMPISGRMSAACQAQCLAHAQEVPARTTESDAMSKDLQRRGFSFVGSTICYAFMQATGMVNDHLVDCFRYAELGG